MERPGDRNPLEDLDKKSNKDLMVLIRNLATECNEKQKACAKLQAEVQVVQNNLTESNVTRKKKIAEYSELNHLVPIAHKANEAKEKVGELEAELKHVRCSKEEKAQRRQELQSSIRKLRTEQSHLENNYAALMENLANVMSQMESLPKSQSQPSRSLTRREADVRLDDLLKQYLPKKLMKSRKLDK